MTRRYSDFDLLNNSLMVSSASVPRWSGDDSSKSTSVAGWSKDAGFDGRGGLALAPGGGGVGGGAPSLPGLRVSPHLLCVQVCGIGLLLPPKKLIGNMDRDFVAERQRGLQAYLDSLTQHPLLSCSLPVKKFLDPSSYSANYTGTAALLAAPSFPGSERPLTLLSASASKQER